MARGYPCLGRYAVPGTLGMLRIDVGTLGDGGVKRTGMLLLTNMCCHCFRRRRALGGETVATVAALLAAAIVSADFGCMCRT